MFVLRLPFRLSHPNSMRFSPICRSTLLLFAFLGAAGLWGQANIDLVSAAAAPAQRPTAVTPSLVEVISQVSSTPCVITVIPVLTPVICNGDGTAVLDLTSPDWALPLQTVDWSDDTYDGMTTATGIPAGNYTVDITDANNCMISINFDVNEPPPLELIDCVGDEDGVFDVPGGIFSFSVSGGVENYTITLEQLPTILTIINTNGSPTGAGSYLLGEDNCIDAGPYTIRVVDAVGCETTCTFNFDPICNIAATSTVFQPDCLGSGGNIEIDFTGVNCTPVTYNWSGGLSGANPTNIPDGTYSVTVADFYGCSAVVGPITIATPIPPMLDCSSVATSGPNSNDGRIELVINDGMAPFNVSWSGPNIGTINTSSNSPTIPGLPPGDYTITVIDALGCENTCMVTVELPPCNLSISCAAVDPAMAGANGGINITINSGFAPYNVFYFGPNNGSAGGEAGPVINLTDLPPGAYNIQVTDALNCTESCMVFITGIDCSNFSVDTSSSVGTCGSANSGAIDLNPMGGMGPYTFDWTLDSLDGIEDPINLPSGMYSVVVSDAQGCSVGPLDFDLQTDPPLALNCTPADATTNGGMDGSITIDLSGGLAPYGLLWTSAMDSDSIANVSDGFMVNNLVAGDYTLLVTDQNGCTISCMATVGEPTCTLSFSGMFTNPVCVGDSSGSISLSIMNATGMLTVDWDDDQYDGMTDLTLLPAGSYTVSVSDESGCTPAPQTFTLTDPAPLSLSCFGNQIDEPALGVDSLVVEVADGTAPYSVTYTGPMSDTQTGLMSDSIVLLVPEGDYTVVVTDANGCVDSCMATILPPSCMDLGFTLAATNNLCAADANGTITLTMTGGFDPFTFSWSDPTLDGMQNPTGLAAGWYIVTVTDIANCMLVDSIEILAPAPIDLNCAATDESTSGGLDGMIDVSFGDGTAPYDISGDLTAAGLTAADSPFNFNSLAPGIYNLVVTDANGCQDSCSAVVNPGGCLINLDFTLVQPSCGTPNGSATVTVNDADAPFTFDWDDDSLDGMSMVTNLTPGDYELTVTDNLGCIVDSSFTIIPFTDFPSVSITPPAAGCFEDCLSYDLSFSGTGPFELSYDFDVPGSGPGSDLLMVPGNMGQLQLCPADFGVESLEGISIDFVRVTDAVCFRDTSVVALPQVLPQPADTLRGLACVDSVLNINGTIFDAATPMGEVILTDASVNGCDSVVVVDLTFLPVPMGTLDTTVCEDQSVTVGTEVFDIGRPMGTATLPDASVNGCDSTVTVTLSFFNPA
ncbi:MAG: SprB repeat-containing protein, partial [Bacteroidota bacterium]